MFVDASAIVAILTREPECDALADLLEEARSPITSPIAIFEAVLGVCRKHRASVEEVEGDIRDFIEITHLQVVSVTERESETALAAFSRYGRGQRHPAQLNMGDCFAYAMAKNHRLVAGHCQQPSRPRFRFSGQVSEMPAPLQQREQQKARNSCRRAHHKV
jgi:ribonuclease VapC